MNTAVTLETIRKEIQQVKNELTDEARQELEKAREEMAKGKFISHEEVMARYG